VNYVLGKPTSSGGGNTKFTEALDELPSISGFDLVQKVLIVADNDTSPAREFAAVVAAINATADIIGPPPSRFAAPPAPLIKAGANPGVVVMMLPWTGVLGSLSTTCLAAAYNAAPNIAACVDTLAACTGADKWTEAKRVKMKLHSLIASSHEPKPNLSPAYVWSENTNLVPLNDPVFSQISNFLRAFPTM
jgi:hypothetical protein